MATSQDYTFTAGAQGVIRRWKTSDLLNGRGTDLEEDVHDEPIWAIALREKLNLLLVSSADQTLQLMKNTPQKLKSVWVSKITKDMPTAVEWMADNRFAAGYQRKEAVGVYEINSGQLGWEYSFEGKGDSSQVNCMQMGPKLKVLVAGHEDHFLRFYDPNSSTLLLTHINELKKLPLIQTQ